MGQKRPLTWDEFKINVMKSVETSKNDSIALHNKYPYLLDENYLDNASHTPFEDPKWKVMMQ